MKKIFTILITIIIGNFLLLSIAWAEDIPMETIPMTADSEAAPALSPTTVIPERTSVPVRNQASLPNIKIPDLQIKIPTVNFTSAADVLSQCAKNSTGKITICYFPWIAEYIAGVYKYAVGVAGILAAIAIMWGGVLWLTAGGNNQRVSAAQDWIKGSLTGLILLATSFLILYQINPDLVGLKPLTVQMLDQIPSPGDTTEFSRRCQPTYSGNCQVSSMSIFGDKAQQASAICMAESSGTANAYNNITKCSNGGYAVWGLFQFNLSANIFYDATGNKLNCPSAFNKEWTNSSPSCLIKDKALYDQCVAAASDPSLSIKNAARLVSASSWGPWESNSKWCHF